MAVTQDPTGEAGSERQSLQASPQVLAPDKPSRTEARSGDLQRRLPLCIKFVRVAAPLNVRLGKSQPFEPELNVEELDSLQGLKNQLVWPLDLALQR